MTDPMQPSAPNPEKQQPTPSVLAEQGEATCLFCRISRGEIPAKKLFADEHLFAFHDIHPRAPIHFLIVPRLHIASLAGIGQEHAALMGHIVTSIPHLANLAGCNPYPHGGFRVVCNTGEEGGQEVAHLHWHVMGGPRPWR